MTLFYLLVENSAVFVKDGDFFVSQGGLVAPWGTHWEPYEGVDLAEARQEAIRRRRERFPHAHRTFDERA